EHWGELFRGREIALRVDLGRGLGHHEKVRTGGSGSKFGLPLEQLDAFLRHADAHGVTVRGLHAHLGSGVLDARHWGEVFNQLARLAERIGASPSSTSAAACACPRTTARRSWTTPSWTRCCARSRRPTRTTSCGWSRAATSWPT